MRTTSGVAIDRVILSQEPFVDWNGKWSGRGAWPAQWIGHPDVRDNDVVVLAFRRVLTVKQQITARIHVTADERYELFVDGERVARGSEWGSPENWFYESYDLTIPAGAHTIVARTWHLGHAGPSPCSQMSLRPGFFLAAEGDDARALLSTGAAAWECRKIPGYHFSWPYPTELPFTGARVRMQGNEIPWGIENGSGDGWVATVNVGHGVNASMMEEQPDNIWLLRPATLPPLFTAMVRAGACRHVEDVGSPETEKVVVESSRNRENDRLAWDALTGSGAAVIVPPRTMRRVILDLQNYHCGWAELTTSGGAGSMVRVGWAESLYDAVIENAGGYRTPSKGDRSTVEGKYFRGFSDVFEPDGGTGRTFRPLWWSAGRYLEVFVRTGEAPLTINALRIEEQHYPYEWRGTFDASDQRLPALMPIYKRTLEMCSHETYMDCPHYEQLMYIADTRLEVLQTYAMTADDRLPRKALTMFDASRRNSGLTQSRYPTRVRQILPTFSLWWIGMMHDYLMWRDDAEFVKNRLVGICGVLDAFRRYLNADGLIEAPVGWNFVDWVPAWDRGCPPDGDRGVSASINLQAAMILRQAAEIEAFFGEKSLAARNRALADAIIETVQTAFWDEHRGLFADDRTHANFSEHAQCLAILGGAVAEDRRERLIQGLLTAQDLHRATIYFSHYLFETYRVTGKMDALFKRLDLWIGLQALGLKTTVETPEPSRSDCHGWGAHPMFHYFASILGIRPAAPGFAKVRIQPQLGPLTWAKGAMPHPRGTISLDLTVNEGRITGTVELPRGVKGEFVAGGEVRKLRGGKQTV